MLGLPRAIRLPCLRGMFSYGLSQQLRSLIEAEFAISASMAKWNITPFAPVMDITT